MMARLLHSIMKDDSLLFGQLPQRALWRELRDHIESLEGAVVTEFITDCVTEAWIDFTYQGHEFTVNDQFGDYWFFAKSHDCPTTILQTVLAHCELLLR